MATPIGAFNNQLVNFVEELTETYTEEKDLRVALDALKAIKKANPKLLFEGFMQYVYPDFHGPVMAEDETILRAKAKDVLNSEFKEYAFAYLIFDRHWSGMTEANKAAIWKYCKVLVVLAERAAGLRA